MKMYIGVANISLSACICYMHVQEIRKCKKHNVYHALSISYAYCLPNESNTAASRQLLSSLVWTPLNENLAYATEGKQ